jgi:hypothetical protein
MKLHLRPRQPLLVMLAIALALAASSSVAACATDKAQSPPPSTSPVTSPASPITAVPDDEELLARLTRAVQSADPAMSAKALDAHIREVTKAPRSLIVAPYDPKAEGESLAFARSMVASHGIDGAGAAYFANTVYESRGKPFHRAEDFTPGGTVYLAGQPVTVRGVDGYVLIGTSDDWGDGMP